MDLNGIRIELRRLADLTAEWQTRGGADELEREVALGMLRRIYEAIRFQESVAGETRTADVAVEVPLTLDLDGILDPSATFPDAGDDGSAPAEPIGAEPVDRPESSAPESAAADEPGEAEPEAAPVPAPEPEPQLEAAPQPAVEAPGIERASEVGTSVGQTADAAAAEVAEAAEVKEPAETAEIAAAAEQPRPAAAERGTVIEPALFGLDEIVQHKRKQRVIMSLYDDGPRRKESASERDSRPEKTALRPAAEAVPIPEITIDDPAARPDDDDRAIAAALREADPVSAPTAEQNPETVSIMEEAPVPAPTAEENVPRPEAADSAFASVAGPAEAPQPTAEAADPLPAGAVLGEVINRDVQTLAETLAAPRRAVADIAQRTPVEDLRAAIGLNDKFLLVRDLFDGDAEACDRAIDTLNGFDDLDECMIHIAEHYAWNPNSDGAKLLMELLERKLA